MCRVGDHGPWVEVDGVIRELGVLEKGFEFREIPWLEFVDGED
jgi:hypothetical protein